jgi:hypothetical protein
MMQRKLTDEELQDVMHARHYLRMVTTFADLLQSRIAMKYLDLVATHGTTDGKPCVEPQPEVGEGYRVATESDAWRKDVEYFSNLKGNGWFARAVHGKPLESSYHYRVPVDRIPTDEDAKQRPTVMVRHHGEKLWRTMPLVAVVKSDRPFITLQGTVIWRFQEARFPYPGELD